MHRNSWIQLALGVALAVLGPVAVPAQERIELEGPIHRVEGTKISLYGGLVSFEAQGAEIETDDESFRNLSDLAPGTDIEVDAVVENGSIRAVRVEVSDEKDPDTEIGGVIGKVDEAAGTFTVGPVTVYFDGSTRLKDLSSGLQAGTLIEATVAVGPDRLRATLIEREEADD